MNWNMLQWIVQHMEDWYAICRVHGKRLKGEDIGRMLQSLLSLCRQDSEFNFILLVFLTEYEEELAFFEHEDV